MNIVFRWVTKNYLNDIIIFSDYNIRRVVNKNLFMMFNKTDEKENLFFVSEDLQSEFKIEGKNIYCNDILKIINEEIKDIRYYKVVFEKGSFVCYHKYGRWGLLSRFFEPDLKHFKLKIAGTIYQNPELLSA